jgi:hypothetical protein
MIDLLYLFIIDILFFSNTLEKQLKFIQIIMVDLRRALNGL